jgi:LacI family transcriptional regulator
VPNSLSQSLRFKKTNMIALMVSDITNPFWTTLTRGVEDACMARGMNVILCNTDENAEKQENYVNVLLQRQTDGFLLVPAGGEPAVVRRIQKRAVPVVVIDRHVEGVHVDIVRSDSEQGAYLLTHHLLERGHRRIALLSFSTSISTARQRQAGYERALGDFGIAPDASLVRHGRPRGDSGYLMTMEAIATMHPRPTAIFTANNFIAIGALNALHDMGIRVPEEISVVSFDEMPYATEPFVTVAAQSPYELGITAAHLLMNIISGEEQPGQRDIVLPVELIERRSVITLPGVPAPVAEE